MDPCDVDQDVPFHSNAYRLLSTAQQSVVEGHEIASKLPTLSIWFCDPHEVPLHVDA
jgi:hypothetical protein